MDLERASDIIKAIPHMSKRISDDTLFEKVLSFLIMVLETYPEAVDTFQRLDIFEQMKQVRLLCMFSISNTEQNVIRHVNQKIKIIA